MPPPSNGRIRPDAFRYRWNRLLQLTGWLTRDPDTKRWKFLREWPANALRHSYASMAYELTNDAPLVAARLGHTDDGDLLFEHYRAMVAKGDGFKFFSLRPAESANVIPFPAQPTTAQAAQSAASNASPLTTAAL